MGDKGGSTVIFKQTDRKGNLPPVSPTLVGLAKLCSVRHSHFILHSPSLSPSASSLKGRPRTGLRRPPLPKAPGLPSLSKALCCPARDRTPSELPEGQGWRISSGTFLKGSDCFLPPPASSLRMRRSMASRKKAPSRGRQGKESQTSSLPALASPSPVFWFDVSPSACSGWGEGGRRGRGPRSPLRQIICALQRDH